MTRSKQLRITTTQVGNDPRKTRLNIEYGTHGTAGHIDVDLNDLSDIVEQLKAGFEHCTINAKEPAFRG